MNIALFFILVILDNKEPIAIRNPLQALSINSSTLLIKKDKTFQNILSPNPLQVSPSIYTDKCAGQWTSDKLVGRCFGLKSHIDYASLKDITVVTDALHCKALCCDLGKECISWQYWEGIKLCKLGGAVRIGGETAATPNWCEPDPPITWTGRRVSVINGTRVEVGNELTTQCFGLGPQKYTSHGDIRVPLTVQDCPVACLADSKCTTWQGHSNRGCFFSSSTNIYCEPYSGTYDGGRKISPTIAAVLVPTSAP